MATRLAQLLSPSRVILALHSAERPGAIEEVSRLLEGHPDIADYSRFYSALLARERLDTTCLGNAIALPHARTEHVKRIVMAVGRSNVGIAYENTPEPVRLVFVLGTPQSDPGGYLKLLGVLCRIFKSAPNREALLAAQTPEDFIARLVEFENQILGAPPA